MAQKTAALKQYAVDASWTNYINNLEPVLAQFIETYKGKVDVSWWNRVMNISSGSLGSGSTTYVSGWILTFFGLSGKVDSGDISSESIDVPVEIDNKLTGIKKTVHIVGGFGGVHKDQGAYRPQMSFIVFHDGTTQ